MGLLGEKVRYRKSYMSHLYDQRSMCIKQCYLKFENNHKLLFSGNDSERKSSNNLSISYLIFGEIKNLIANN